MKKTKQLLMGIFLGGILSPLLVNCSTEMMKTVSMEGGRMLQDAGRALLADAGQVLMDSGQVMEDAGEVIGDSGVIKDAQAQTMNNGGGSVCYVAWDTQEPGCGADFTEMYSGYAFTAGIRGSDERNNRIAAARESNNTGVTLAAAIGDSLCVKTNGPPSNGDITGDTAQIWYYAANRSATQTLQCAVCCK